MMIETKPTKKVKPTAVAWFTEYLSKLEETKSIKDAQPDQDMNSEEAEVLKSADK